MKIYFAADHAGFELKNILIEHVRALGHSAEDCGAHVLDAEDDYPPLIRRAAQKLGDDVMQRLDSRAIVIGGSGQGEAIVANRIKGVRCGLYYGAPKTKQTDAEGKEIDIIESIRLHNDANALSLGARFLSADEAKAAVEKWLAVPFVPQTRHERRVWQIDSV
jgi:ribose 5-phosphate isomerase B